jgi:hypothetical protein
VTNRLQTSWVSAREETIAQRLKGNPGLAQLLFRPFVSIDAHLDVKRKVGADLDKEQPKVFIQDVEVIIP